MVVAEPTQWQRDLVEWILANPDKRVIVNMPRQHGRGYVDRRMREVADLLGIKIIGPPLSGKARPELKGARRDDPQLAWWIERDNPSD